MLVLDEPNLGLLGTREKSTAGCQMLAEIDARLKKITEDASFGSEYSRSDAESASMRRIDYRGLAIF